MAKKLIRKQGKPDEIEDNDPFGIDEDETDEDLIEDGFEIEMGDEEEGEDFLDDEDEEEQF